MTKSSSQLSALSSQPNGAIVAEVARDHRFDDPRSEAVEFIPLRELRRASWNARKTFSAESISELRTSIQQHGIQVPLIVRPMAALADILSNPEAAAKSGRAFEIVCGHRRFEAALNGGTKTGEVPCVVRDLTDDQAREIGLIDNLQREDVPAMEEAAAFAELLTRLGSIAAVAARVGKEQGYVAKRLKLTSCTMHVADALRGQLITVDHALLLARLGADEQNAALKWCLDTQAGPKKPVEDVIAEILEERREGEKEKAKGAKHYWSDEFEPESVLRLKEHIAEDSGTLLSRAPWRLDDAALDPDAGACSACPQNTSANTPLFGDLAIGEPTCTDGGCFKAKTKAFVQLMFQEAQRAKKPIEPTIVRVSWRQTSTAPRMLKADPPEPMLDQVFKAGQWVEAKNNSCEHVRAAVTVDWSDAGDRGYMGAGGKLRKPGELLQVCVAQKCKAHRKEYEKPKSSQGGERYDAKAEEEKRERLRQAAMAETKIRVAVASKAIENLKELPAEALRDLVAGSFSDWGDLGKARNAIVPGFEKILKTAKVDSLAFVRAAALLSIDKLAAYHYREAKDGRAEFLASIARLGYKDGAKAWEEFKAAEKTAKKAAAKAAAAKTPAKAKKPILSAEARKRIAAAQQKRWAAAKKGGAK